MKLQMVGCSHHNAPLEVRERLAFSPDQTRTALVQLRAQFPETEAVLISTCNRVELYAAASNGAPCPTSAELVQFLADFHGRSPDEIADALHARGGPRPCGICLRWPPAWTAWWWARRRSCRRSSRRTS